ncbi:MAG: MauE/DoxX family redox-associated membrane protein [Bergeyella sp.]
MRNKYVIEIVCFLVSIVFVYAGIIKLLDNRIFVMQLHKSPLLPDFTAVPISIIFPVVEIFAGIGVFIGRLRKISLYVSLILFSLFTAYLIILNSFFIDVPCSCGGILGKMSYEVHILFNLFFLCIIIIALNKYGKTTNN